MSPKNKIALLLIGAGLVSGIAISYHLPAEKLALALTGPTAVVGAGLAQWSTNKEDCINNDSNTD
jgi:predicted metal-binding membrane protein